MARFDECECPNCGRGFGDCLAGFCADCLTELGTDGDPWGAICDDCGPLFTTCEVCEELTIPIDIEGFAPDVCDKCEGVTD